MCGRAFFLCLSSLCALCASVVSSVSAHPVPKDNHDRTIVVRLTPRAVEVDYTLDLDEGRAARDVARAELAGISTPEEFYEAFLRWLAPVLADNLDARLDGKPLAFVCKTKGQTTKDKDGTPLAHLRCRYTFEAPWEPAPGRPHAFTFREANYHDDDFSLLNVALEASPGVRLSAVTAPDKALQERPPLDRRPGDGERLRRLSATFTVPDQTPKGESRSGPAEGAGEIKPAQPEGPSRDGGRPSNLLHLLLETRHGLVMALLMAAFLGAAHALTPGHGKTLVAAYLVGERGTVGHAVLLGCVTTATHTAAVLLLAALLPAFFPDTPDASVQAALGLVGGLLIAGLGFWLLMRRLAGQADHVHLPGHGHHHHHHGHDHDHVHLPSPGSRVGFWQLVVLGVQGGIVPCWDAIAMLCVAISAQRLWLGLPLLLAFSAGLAGVLILIGIGVVYTRDWAGGRWGDGPRARRLARALPLASAVLITLMGLWLCYDSTHGGAH